MPVYGSSAYASFTTGDSGFDSRASASLTNFENMHVPDDHPLKDLASNMRDAPVHVDLSDKKQRGLAVLKRKLAHDGRAKISEELVLELWPANGKSTGEKLLGWAEEENVRSVTWNEDDRVYIFEA